MFGIGGPIATLASSPAPTASTQTRSSCLALIQGSIASWAWPWSGHFWAGLTAHCGLLRADPAHSAGHCFRGGRRMCVTHLGGAGERRAHDRGVCGASCRQACLASVHTAVSSTHLFVSPVLNPVTYSVRTKPVRQGIATLFSAKEKYPGSLQGGMGAGRGSESAPRP